MFGSLLLALATSAAPATYFYAAGPTLMRAQVPLAAQVASGAVEVAPVSVAAVRLPGFLAFHHQALGEAVAVVCREEPQRTDEPKPCDVFHVDRAGRALPLKVRALSAYLLPGGRFAFWTDGLQLRSRALLGGPETLLASSVIDPVPGADGRQFGVAFAPGATRLTLGTDACPAVVPSDLAAEPARLPGPCQVGSAPFLSPSGIRLYVSTQGGMAAFWTQQGSLPAVQRTQVGVTELNASFVPVAGRELIWLSDTTALYTARYERDELWSFDVRSGRAARLHPGAGPAWVEDGAGQRAVLAADGARLLQLAGVAR